MSHRFAVGDWVEYKPIGAKIGRFKITRLMPEEFQASDWKYRVKSEDEPVERTAWQFELSPSLVPGLEEQPKVKPIHIAKRSVSAG